MRYLRRNSSNFWTGPSSFQAGFLRFGTIGMTHRDWRVRD